MAPLSSEGWRADESFSSADSEAIQTRLEEGACDCGGLRPMSRSFPTAEIAQHYLAAALSPIASELLDPLIITPGEELKMTIRAYLNSSHTGGANVALKMPLVKFEELAAIDGAKLEDMPLHPYFYGAWLGDGTHNQPSITASAADVEMKRFLEDMRDDLNASPSRPAGSTPVHLYITETAGVSAPILVMTIRGKEGQGPLVWSPVRRALQDLGVFANHKCNGIPAVFKNANEEVRAMVLAGLIDTDGSLTQQLAYVIGQSVAHRVIIDDARALARSLGIQVSEVRPTLRSGRFYNGHWIAESHGFAFEMSGPALRKLQPYILLPRKRLADDLEHHWYDKDGRAVQIEPLNPSTPLYGRELHMPGREMPLIQHKDGYVLSAK